MSTRHMGWTRRQSLPLMDDWSVYRFIRAFSHMYMGTWQYSCQGMAAPTPHQSRTPPPPPVSQAAEPSGAAGSCMARWRLASTAAALFGLSSHWLSPRTPRTPPTGGSARHPPAACWPASSSSPCALDALSLASPSFSHTLPRALPPAPRAASLPFLHARHPHPHTESCPSSLPSFSHSPFPFQSPCRPFHLCALGHLLLRLAVATGFARSAVARPSHRRRSTCDALLSLPRLLVARARASQYRPLATPSRRPRDDDALATTTPSTACMRIASPSSGIALAGCY